MYETVLSAQKAALDAAIYGGERSCKVLDGVARKLIDDAGLKKTTVGDAEVSELHAGFIVNNGNAKSSDVLNLIQIVKNRIFDLNGILLEEEIIYIE